MLLSQQLSTIKAFHAALTADISELLENLRDYEDAFPLLCRLQDEIFNVVQFQDDRFFSALKAANADQPKLLKMIYFLEQDSLELKVESLEFFDRFSKDISLARKRNFPREFDAFSRRILQWISLETEYLFPLLGV
ncbi:MAG TPA: hypothetical protein VLJ10_04960 [Candidatus Bathyarchaeia archaeon]|nr:hypothetical protein [Candidatus Bathyarchaeia archaeon]